MVHSNAWALEIAASQNRNVGSLITLAQFVLVSLVGLPKRLCILTRYNQKVRRRRSCSAYGCILTIGQFQKGQEVARQWEPFRFRTLIHQPSSLLRIRFKPLAIPVSRWMVQVVLFLLTSLLNNAAFKYRVPMAIHIIFRSAGLVTNLLLGRFWAGKT
jgi:UDP-xylose/UDP-N-acetylglucosamine transporter B4